MIAVKREIIIDMDFLEEDIMKYSQIHIILI